MGNKSKRRGLSLTGGRRSRSRRSRALSRRRGMAGGILSKRRGMAGGILSKRRGMAGGGGAADFVEKNFGSGDQQFNKVFIGSGATDNALQPLNGSPSISAQPTSGNLSLIQSAGGKGRRRRMSRSKKGGYFGSVLSTAAAPLALFGLNYKYGRRRQ